MIPELGRTLVCEDRGGKIKGNRLDIYMNNVDKALHFGKRRLLVFVMEGDVSN
ncbi:3D domain-containing protein [Brevibacillus parabrevis]|uniref:3D domain-containing protein n=1 Tax=Brevibacillus parabrevis TaxID=54914 RepID=UPI001C22C1B1|nr:3D domain-containing protein [Brevibacillus parabrevis]